MTTPGASVNTPILNNTTPQNLTSKAASHILDNKVTRIALGALLLVAGIAILGATLGGYILAIDVIATTLVQAVRYCGSVTAPIIMTLVLSSLGTTWILPGGIGLGTRVCEKGYAMLSQNKSRLQTALLRK